jgi:hypothetical protein
MWAPPVSSIRVCLLVCKGARIGLEEGEAGLLGGRPDIVRDWESGDLALPLRIVLLLLGEQILYLPTQPQHNEMQSPVNVSTISTFLHHEC